MGLQAGNVNGGAGAKKKRVGGFAKNSSLKRDLLPGKTSGKGMTTKPGLPGTEGRKAKTEHHKSLTGKRKVTMQLLPYIWQRRGEGKN